MDKRALEIARKFDAAPPEIQSLMLRVLTAMRMPGVEFSTSEVAQICTAARARDIRAVDGILRRKIVTAVK